MPGGAGQRHAEQELVGSPAVVLTRLGTGRPTVLLHGGGPGCTSGNDFAAVLDLLTPERALLLVDLPQFGQAEAVRITGPVWDFHAARIADLLDTLDLRHADIVGQSFGGCVALRLAALRPELVRRVVATGSQPTPYARPDGPGAEIGRQVRERYYRDGGPSRAKMRELIAGLEWHDPRRIPAQLVDRRYEASILPGPLAFGVDHGGRGRPQDLSGQLAEVRAKVLLIWGEHDPFTDPGYARQLASRLPDAQVEVVPAAAHHPQSEHPDRYAALVQQFLSTPDSSEQL